MACEMLNSLGMQSFNYISNPLCYNTPYMLPILNPSNSQRKFQAPNTSIPLKDQKAKVREMNHLPVIPVWSE